MKYTTQEDAIIKELYLCEPEVDKIVAHLPGRNWESIKGSTGKIESRCVRFGRGVAF